MPFATSHRLAARALFLALPLSGCSQAHSQDAAPATPAPIVAPGTGVAPPAYFGPNAIGTGTTASPSPNIPFVDSAASCASILDTEARRLCLQAAGRR